MNGELAETISLAAHGSQWLSAPHGSEPPALDADHSTYRFVESIRFVLRPRGPRRSIEASSVPAWLAQLRERGVERLWLSIPEAVTDDPPERMLVGFSGAGSWHLLTSGAGAEGWHGNWEVNDADAPDQRIWRVLYLGVMLNKPVTPERPDLTQTHQGLLTDLRSAHEFAARLDLEPWTEWFERAIALGTTDDDPEPPWHPDLLPARGYGPKARRLISMAAQSWVFGGMGSWNDLGFDRPDHAQYEDVSRRLYSSVLRAFVAATNSDLT